MASIEERITKLVESISVDTPIEDEVFFWLFDELREQGSGQPNIELTRLVLTKLIDFFAPDDEQMLYLLLTPNIPLLYAVRLENKPYDYAVMMKNRSYYLDFDAIYRILAESSIEHQPLTILADDSTIPPLEKHFIAGRYDLPEGSRIVRYTDTPSRSSKECEKIFGVPPMISFYRPRGIVSYCGSVNGSYRIPAWMRIINRNDNELDFLDLASFSSRGKITNVMPGCYVDNQFIHQ